MTIRLLSCLLSMATQQAVQAADASPAAAARSSPAEPVQAIATPAGPTCAEPFPLPRPGGSLSGFNAQLRNLAAVCDQETHAQLFFNRAYHVEVVEELEMLAQLQKGYASNDRRRLEATRIFVGLGEVFAEQAWHHSRDPAAQNAVIKTLNQAYELAIQDVELTLRGFDLLVGQPFNTR
jgi:hypothetical protein